MFITDRYILRNSKIVSISKSKLSVLNCQTGDFAIDIGFMFASRSQFPGTQSTFVSAYS